MVGDVCPRRLLTVAKGTPSHHEPGGEGMAEVVEVEIGQACALTGPIKGVPDIVPPVPVGVVKHPGHVLPGS